MKIIGLTGGIASGKSTVARHLKKLGAKIIDADKVAHELSQPKAPLWQIYRELFGQTIITKDSTLDRKAVGQIIFTEPQLRQKVDNLVRPLIKAEIERRIGEFKPQGYAAIVLDVPLLLEAGWQNLAEEVWLSYVPRRVQLTRLMNRDQSSEEMALKKINSQMDMEAKRKQAAVIIDNSGSLEETWRQIETAWNERVIHE